MICKHSATSITCWSTRYRKWLSRGDSHGGGCRVGGGWRRRTEKHSTVAKGGAWRVACTDKIQPFRHALTGSSLHPGPDWRGEWLQSRQLPLLTLSIDTHTRVLSRIVSKDKPYFLQNCGFVCQYQYNKAKNPSYSRHIQITYIFFVSIYPHTPIVFRYRDLIVSEYRCLESGSTRALTQFYKMRWLNL